jgi:geranylgeranyl pyrophosphate synthase
MISEMYHTASLVHDDVIDRADMRRGKDSLNKRWGQRNAIWAGNFVVAISNKILGQMNDPTVSL